ncbi:RNA-binding protein [Cytobacillus sp. FJAT-54145]|uniref:RNA-binding protein n=1 Tax=Cytobacillus spartinae TaxID=3299023 RepID=A0ABW6K477_9BACI
MSIYQHFRPEERDFIDQVMNWKDHVENTFVAKVTDFLDPREQQIVKTIIGTQADVKVEMFGGMPGAERQRALIYPEYHQVDLEDYEICLFEVDYPSKFVTLEHPQVLGSLMSLGLKRGKFGDILLEQDRVQFFAAKEVSDYIMLQLDSIGRASISLREMPLSDVINVYIQWNETSTTVSSLRLDTVLSAIHNISRQKSQLYINQGLVKVNWTTIENNAFECGEGDILSARGFGRAKIISIEGRTKKDKLRIIVGKQI